MLKAPGFENWNYTVENVDGALHVGIIIAFFFKQQGLFTGAPYWNRTRQEIGPSTKHLECDNHQLKCICS